ncbi:hypothetical protein HYZ41_00850 [archaeon]|nr:hypothetical protein [archaeon]
MIEIFIKKEQLIRDKTIKNLAGPYLKKSRSNLVTMEVLGKVEKYKDVLAIPKDYSAEEWIVVAAYYAMYMAALSLLAKLGFRSKSHTATSVALGEFFVKKKLLDKIYLENFENIRMKKEEIEMLHDVRDRREIAQYSVTKKTTKEIAEHPHTHANLWIG